MFGSMRDHIGLLEPLHYPHLWLFRWFTHECLVCTTFLPRYCVCAVGDIFLILIDLFFTNETLSLLWFLTSCSRFSVCWILLLVLLDEDFFVLDSMRTSFCGTYVLFILRKCRRIWEGPYSHPHCHCQVRIWSMMAYTCLRMGRMPCCMWIRKLHVKSCISFSVCTPLTSCKLGR